MTESYNKCVELLEDFLESGKEWRKEKHLPNPENRQSVRCVFSPSWRFTAFKIYSHDEIVFNVYLLLVDYLQLGKNDVLKSMIDGFLKDGSSDPTKAYSLLEQALNEWKNGEQKICIPLSIAIKELGSAWFLEKFKQPNNSDGFFMYIYINELFSYIIRDHFFRGLDPLEISQRVEFTIREAIDILIDWGMHPPSPETYSKVFELKGKLAEIINSEKLEMIPKLLIESSDFDSLLFSINSMGENDDYIG